MHSLAFGFHIYVIYTTKRLDAQRNKQTTRNRSLSSFKMQSQSHEFSYFLNYEKDLESLAEDYFSTRPAVVEDDQLYDYSSDSSDETDQEIDSDVDFNFSECDLSEGSKVHAFAAKTCGCAHGDNADPCSSTTEMKTSSIAETTVRNVPQLNSIW